MEHSRWLAVHSPLCGVAFWDLLKEGTLKGGLGCERVDAWTAFLKMTLTFDIWAWFGEREAKSDDDDDELRVDDGDF